MDIRGIKVGPVTLGRSAAPGRFSPWCFSRGKRLFDCSVSAIALVLAAPLMAVVAIALKATEPGERILFRHQRVGEGGREFEVLKFRTMSSGSGSNLTSANDHRVTALGRLLRRSKLDELPQLVNVLTGDMSLVGPRPDTKDFIDTLATHNIDVLMLKPGVTGAASLRFRNEETLFAQIPQAKLTQHYINVVLPEKVRLDIEYARTATFVSDLKLLFRTALALAD